VVPVAADDCWPHPVLRRLPRRHSTGGPSKLSGDVRSDRERRDPYGGDCGEAFAAAEARIVAYWADECARDLDRLVAHFARDAEVITPEGSFRGHQAIAALYQKSFDSFPGLKVDVKASFAGRGAHCFEYSAVLSDAANNHWLIEGVNLMKLQDGLIGRLRSFEDAPRLLPTDGQSSQ
jgi:hypothetical protein